MKSLKCKICFLWFSLTFAGCSFTQPPPPKNEVCFDDHCFEVELALTPEAHQQGLMFRESLDLKKGMLFIFDSPQRRDFWMKNTRIPLDILWFNEAYRVVGMVSQAPVCDHDPCPIYNSPNFSLYVLEINAGLAQKWGIGIGSKAEFKLENL